MVSLGEYMAERKEVSRWVVASAFVLGMFCGAILTVAFMWTALV